MKLTQSGWRIVEIKFHSDRQNTKSSILTYSRLRRKHPSNTKSSTEETLFSPSATPYCEWRWWEGRRWWGRGGGGRGLRRALGYQCRKIQAAMQHSVRLTPRLLRSCGTVCRLFPRGTADAEIMSPPLLSPSSAH